MNEQKCPTPNPAQQTSAPADQERSSISDPPTLPDEATSVTTQQLPTSDRIFSGPCQPDPNYEYQLTQCGPRHVDLSDVHYMANSPCAKQKCNDMDLNNEPPVHEAVNSFDQIVHRRHQ